MASNEEVEEQRDAVIELRARVEEARNGGAQTQRELDNEIILTQLKAEEARLAAELAEVEANNDRRTLVQGADAPLQAAKDQMASAVARQKAVDEAVAAKNRAAAPPAPTAPTTPGDLEPPVQTAAEATAAKKKVEG